MIMMIGAGAWALVKLAVGILAFAGMVIGGLTVLSLAMAPGLVSLRDRREACDPVDCTTLGCPDGERCEARGAAEPFVWSPPAAQSKAMATAAVRVPLQAACNRPRKTCAWCGLVMQEGDRHVVSDGICNACLRQQMAELAEYNKRKERGNADA